MLASETMEAGDIIHKIWTKSIVWSPRAKPLRTSEEEDA